jgi:hypothetical protein
MSQQQSDLRAEVEDLKDRVSSLEAKLEENPTAATEATNLEAFVDRFDPSTHKERAVSIGYFLEHYEGQNFFTTPDIEDGYRTCRMKLPANMSDVLNNAEDVGWIMRDGSGGQTTNRKLTKDGIKMVEEVIDDES